MSSSGQTIHSLSAGRGLAVPHVFETAQEAWRASLEDLYHHGETVAGVKDAFSVGSAFGRKQRDTRELLAASFSIASPRRRLINSKQRPIDLGYAIANTVWTLIGSDSAEIISFYNPNGRSFSDDGTRLFAAPGARIFFSPEGNQLAHVIQKLKKDPSTRRAVIQLFTFSDLFSETRDCSCAVSIQFLLRNNELSCVTYMRSQSALMVMPYDLFLFTMLHEVVALCVGVKPGAYHHFCGSLHYYQDEEETVRAVLEEEMSLSPEMPVMQSASSDDLLKLSSAEQEIRRHLTEAPHSPVELKSFGLDYYWVGLLNALIIGVRRRRNLPMLEEEELGVPNIYRTVLTNRE
jgi:thymidylate synthase